MSYRTILVQFIFRIANWTFDEGLLGVSARYVVISSPQLAVQRNTPGHLLTLPGQRINVPQKESLWPDLQALSWHRRNVFRRR